MKKLFIIMALAIFAISANAQKLEGTYAASDDFLELVDTDFDGDGVWVGFYMFFKGDVVNLIFVFDSIDKEMTVTCGFTYPGKFTKTDNTYNCEFNKDNVSFSIINLETDDPEIEEALYNDEVKKQIYKKLEDSLKDTMKPQMKVFSSICDFFNSFSTKWVSYDGYTIVLSHDGEKMEIDFDKL